VEKVSGEEMGNARDTSCEQVFITSPRVSKKEIDHVISKILPKSCDKSRNWEKVGTITKTR